MTARPKARAPARRRQPRPRRRTSRGGDLRVRRRRHYLDRLQSRARSAPADSGPGRSSANRRASRSIPTPAISTSPPATATCRTSAQVRALRTVRRRRPRSPGSGPRGPPALRSRGAPAPRLLPRRGLEPGGASASVVVQRGGCGSSFDGKLTPHALPRHGTAPVGIAVDARIARTGGGDAAAAAADRDRDQPQRAFQRRGPAGLPDRRDIQPSTTAGARAACGGSLVGEGHFSANVKLPQQSPFPSSGKVLAFNGRLHGKPAILAHIYGTRAGADLLRAALPDPRVATAPTAPSSKPRCPTRPATGGT